jgi:hypothetical protein
MNWFTKKEQPPALMPVGSGATAESMTLAEILAELEQSGHPTMYKSAHSFSEGNWRCWNDMRITAAGATFNIKGDHSPTATQAAQSCLDRVRATLLEMKK